MHYARAYKCAVVLLIVGAIAVSCIADVALHLYGLLAYSEVVPVHGVFVSILPDLASVVAAFLCCIASRYGSDSDYREVQPDSTPEMMFEKCHTKIRKRSISNNI